MDGVSFILALRAALDVARAERDEAVAVLRTVRNTASGLGLWEMCDAVFAKLGISVDIAALRHDCDIHESLDGCSCTDAELLERAKHGASSNE